MNRNPEDLLDDLDRLIVAELARDGRTPSSDLAHQLGITKSVAASRVRRLIESGIVHVTAVFDVDAAGYQWQANCFIKSTGIAVVQIAGELAELTPTWMVASALGRCDVVGVFMFADKPEMSTFLTEQLPAIRGVHQFECDVVVRPMWYEPLATNTIVHARDAANPLVRVDVPIAFPNPVVDVDDLDNAIITNLRIDGRNSNRRIARELDVSEGTIRSRIKRLQEAGLMRIVAWIDPQALGRTGHVLYLRILLGSASPDDVAADLAAIPQLTSTTAVVGRPNISAMAVAVDTDDTHEVLHAVRAINGVIDVEALELVHVPFFRSHFVRVPNAAARNRRNLNTANSGASTRTCWLDRHNDGGHTPT